MPRAAARCPREVRLTAGQDYVEIINTLDKQRIAAADYRSKEGKESLNFGFPFAVPGGQVRLEVPFGVIRPDADQIPSACKNWFTVGRWADVANEQLRRHLGDPGCASGAGRRPDREPAQLAVQSGCVAQAGRPDAEALLLGDEQPLGHELPCLPGRASRFPLSSCARIAATTRSRLRAWPSRRASRSCRRRHAGRRHQRRRACKLELGRCPGDRR